MSSKADVSGDSSQTIEEDLVPPPGYTTLRVDSKVCLLKAKKILELLVENDLKFRDTPPCYRRLNLSVESHPVIPDVLLIPVQKLLNVQPVETEVIVDRSCGVAVLRGAHVFAPGIIAAPHGLKIGDNVSVYVDLKKRCLKGALKLVGDKYFIGNGIAKVSRDYLFSPSTVKISGVGVKMNRPIFLTPCLDPTLLPSSLFLQNLPSIIVGHVLNLSENCIALDMCAAPGGKATHLCSMMRSTGRVVALDRSKAKIRKIKENAERLGLSSNLSTYCADSRKILSDLGSALNERPDLADFAPPYPPDSFMYILLDAPCSALGQRPRFPGGENASQASLSSYPVLQWQLFKTAVKLLAVGGTLVYSTCTTTYGENEGMVEKALKEFPDMCLASQHPHIGNVGRQEACNLPQELLNKLQYFDMLPTGRRSAHPADQDTIGFFIAKFQKV